MPRLILLLAFFTISLPVLAGPDGHKLYSKHCSVCHNENGIGGIGLPLSSDKIEHYTRDYLFKTIRLGRVGRIMPPFDKLSDAQINAIVDHVFSWKKDPVVDTYSDEPIQGDTLNGQKLFEQKCASCHGKHGKSEEGLGTGVTVSRERKFQVVPPALNNPGFLAAANDRWIKKVIQTERPGSTMPSQAALQLTDQELNDIVSFIRSYENQYVSAELSLENPPTLVFDSPYDFMTTIKNLKQSLVGMNFRYFPDRYMEMGLADDNVINKKQLSLRFCNFEELYKMINIEPRLGIVLPCRITVVEHPDGQVKLYIMNMKMVSLLFNNTQLTETAESMQKAMMELIDEVIM